MTGAGHVTQDQNGRVINRRYPDHTLVFSYSDGASLEFRGKYYEINKYDCFFIPQMEIHTYGTLPGHIWESYWVSFKASDGILETWNKLLPTTINIPNERLKYLFEQIGAAVKRDAAYEEYTATLFNMMAVLRTPLNDTGIHGNDYLMEQAHRFIMQNLHRSLSLDEIAEEAGYSSTHFARLFKKRYGMAVNEYIIGRRIAQAQLLLAQTRLPVKQVSYQCGFNDQLYFSRLFKKKLKITPTDFRKYYR